jgi:peptide/nickel transport system substrate-binding protein
VDNRGVLFPTQPEEGKTTKEGAPIGNNVTNDLAIRQAVNYVIDRKTLVKGILEGFGSPAFAPANGTPWDQPQAAIEDANLDAAKKILADGGWKPGADGIMEKNGLKAEFQLVYPASDSTRQALALASVDMVKQIGIKVTPIGRSWDEIPKLRHSNPVLFGWGSHDATEIYNLYHGAMAGVGSYNAGYYQNARTDSLLDRAMGAPSEEESVAFWKDMQWDGKEGVTAQGDAVWAWLVNLDHTYFVSTCLNVGTPQVEPHGHGWPITANITSWTWTCN